MKVITRLPSLSFKVNLGCISSGLPFLIKIFQFFIASDIFTSACIHFELGNVSQEKEQVRWIFLKEEVYFLSTICWYCRKSVVCKKFVSFQAFGLIFFPWAVCVWCLLSARWSQLVWHSQALCVTPRASAFLVAFELVPMHRAAPSCCVLPHFQPWRTTWGAVPAVEHQGCFWGLPTTTHKFSCL